MSSLAEINRIIRSQNPFDGYFVVKSHQVWGKELPDVHSLHSQASETVLDAVKKINDGKLETAGIIIQAEKGSGKTHILSRIRHRLQREGQGIFIYLSEYGDLTQVKQQFLQGIIASLRKPGKGDVMQCQHLMTLLTNKVVKRPFTALQLTKIFPGKSKQNPDLVEELTNRIYKLGTAVEDPNIIRALIWTLSSVHAPYALNWLAGKELTTAQSTRMSLPNINEEDRSAYAFRTAIQILNLISYCSTPIICFDELDGTEAGGDDDAVMSGFTRAQVVASLGKDIYNNIKQGVLVTAMYQSTWNREIKTLPQAEAVMDRIASKNIQLRHLKIEDVISLISRWLCTFYIENEVSPPHKLYPFNEGEIRRNFEDERPTVRDVLQWCSDEFRPEQDDTSKLQKLYEEAKNSIGEEIFDDDKKIADSLAFCLQYVIGSTIEGVTIQSVDKNVTPKSKNNGYIQFKVIGQEAGKTVKLGVCVLTNSHGKAVGAGLRRLTLYKDLDLTRGCLVRKNSIPHHWQAANEYLDKLIREIGGEWVSPDEADVRSLVALTEIGKSIQDYGINDEQFRQFIEEKGLISKNFLVKEILSEPSGEEPREVIDTDDELEEALEKVSSEEDSSFELEPAEEPVQVL